MHVWAHHRVPAPWRLQRGGPRAWQPMRRYPIRPTSSLSAQPASYDRWVQGQLLFLHVKGSLHSKSLQPTKSSSFRFVYRIVPLSSPLPPLLLHLLLLLCDRGGEELAGAEPDPRGGSQRHRALRWAAWEVGARPSSPTADESRGGWWAICSPAVVDQFDLSRCCR